MEASCRQIISPYEREAERLADQYESVAFEEIHAKLLGWIPEKPAFVLDFGAGSGRDAAWFADRGHEIVAVEPAGALLDQARRRHRSPRIRWVSDRLPALDRVLRSGLTFDLIWLSAVWMHLPPRDRARAFRKLVTLLGPAGRIVITLREGPTPEDRVMFDCQPEEIERLARDHGLALLQAGTSRDRLGRAEVSWHYRVFQLPDDGLGALPLLRHVILSDAKSSTCKLALLRTLVRIADSAAGLAEPVDDDTVGIPLGLVALFWIRAFKPLVDNGIPQMPANRAGKGLGFVKQGFRGLSEVSPYDLRVGGSIGGERARSLHAALTDARDTIVTMPAHYITWPGETRPVFDCERHRPSLSRHLLLNRVYLRSFGLMKVPRHIWQAMARYAAWVEPAIVNEWSALMHSYRGGEALAAERHLRLLRWLEPEHDTRLVRQQVAALRSKDIVPHCVWSGKALRGEFGIDHCLPFAAWPCNDLWNLLPASPRVNAQKRDRLPAADTLFQARERILDWWQQWEGPFRERLRSEALGALPGVEALDTAVSLENVFDGLVLQRSVLKRDQQLADWESR